jgi:hypothetical protein
MSCHSRCYRQGINGKNRQFLLPTFHSLTSRRLPSLGRQTKCQSPLWQFFPSSPSCCCSDSLFRPNVSSSKSSDSFRFLLAAPRFFHLSICCLGNFHLENKTLGMEILGLNYNGSPCIYLFEVTEPKTT